MAVFLAAWPWENLGSHKYLLYGPFVARILYLRTNGEALTTSWCFHILLLSVLRVLVHQLWTSFVNIPFLSYNRRINQLGPDFEQIDQEWHWDNFIILQAAVAVLLCYIFPCIGNLRLWDARGYAAALMIHVVVSEPLYYMLHTLLHRKHIFDRYHALHHSSLILQPFTEGHGTFLEHLLIIPVIAAPIFVVCLIGYGSLSLVYGYILIFDFMRCLGHCNTEIFPHQIFEAFPILRYLIYTPTYHSIHHADNDSNYCLFMPFFDLLGGTLSHKSWDALRNQTRVESGKKGKVPDFVFLAHFVGISSGIHSPFVFRSFASVPYSMMLFHLPIWPVAAIVMMLLSTCAKTYVLSSYHLRGKLNQIWLVPKFSFQYFLPGATANINKQIEEAILQADELGVEVIILGALNKNEALNGGGTLIVKKHPNLRIRIVHGNTLTAAVILHEIPNDVKEVFLTGATSKLGRALALFLCRKKVRVMMLTESTERFQKIRDDAELDHQRYLVQVTHYKAAKECKTWIVGKWIRRSEQKWAPAGTHFHQFVVPQVSRSRKDCTYGDLAAMRLPKDVQGLGHCEFTMPRNVVHACHAGGLVHFLEGWTHHEVGAIDVDKIELVWKAALKHGLRPLSN